ncbi:glycoside hydrolase family 24 protein [Pseudomonas sp. TH31]|uniref:glycoside hydrolase family 24 protein n=1 Tax=Pseudomonas sp. TH31 TaxID=2796396 RepID=UPI0019138614|nr:glycoside hydrolase family 104 protein [Pseudomonas sp. TH31]MBK5416165.1 glycoside hydrolase family 104 protein [Pseudomonas sp. TH31]
MAKISEGEAGGRNVLAFLDMLAWSEGTDNGIQTTLDDGYDVIVGGALFTSYVDHPRILVILPKLGIKSTAAGRYQLLSRYWDAYKESLELGGGFTPENQDRIAIKQIRERRAIESISDGRVVEGISKCRNIWASLPGAGYRQHEQSLDNLICQFVLAGGSVRE